MRLVSPQQQAQILQETCHFLSMHSNFKIKESSEAGPCGSGVRIITGEEEGLFGWIAVNYLMDGFTGSSGDRTTYGFLDMGGASTQIAFEPSLENQRKTNNHVDVRLRLLGGEEIHHKVFVTTWLGYGTNQARERYVGKTVTESRPGEAHRPLAHGKSTRILVLRFLDSSVCFATCLRGSYLSNHRKIFSFRFGPTTTRRELPVLDFAFAKLNRANPNNKTLLSKSMWQNCLPRVVGGIFATDR